MRDAAKGKQPLLACFRVWMYYRRMDEVAYTESAEYLCQLAASRGYTVTEDQLVRWRREGLIAEPKHPSLGRGRGSLKALYPHGTGGQLLAACDVRRHDRRFAVNRWQLWWRGHEIETAHIRPWLEKMVKDYERILADASRNGGYSDATLDALFARPTPLLAKVRKRIGQDAFRQCVRIMVRLASGTFTGWERDDEDIFEAALGMERARNEKHKGGKPWLSGDQTEQVRLLFEVIQPRAVRVAVEEALKDESGATLREARDELCTALTALSSLATFLTHIFRKDFGFGLAMTFIKFTPQDQCGMLMLWLSLRRTPGFSDQYRVLVDALSAFIALSDITTVLAEATTPQKKPRTRRASGQGEGET